MHRITIVFAAVLAAALVAPTALADKPIREPLPAPPFILVTGSCSFDVGIEFLVNKEFIKTFSNGKQLITGRLVVRVTNLASPTKSRVLNISGPGKNDAANQSAFNLNGSSLIFFPGVLRLTHGPVTLTIDASGNVIGFRQTSSSSTDLCAVLA